MSHDALIRDLLTAGWSAADVARGYGLSEEQVHASLARTGAGGASSGNGSDLTAVQAT